MYVKEEENYKNQAVIDKIIVDKNIALNRSPVLEKIYLQDILEFLFKELSYEKLSYNNKIRYNNNFEKIASKTRKMPIPQTNPVSFTPEEIVKWAQEHQEEYSPLEYDIIS